MITLKNEKDFLYEVYVDDISKWRICKITRKYGSRVQVITNDGILLDRIFKETNNLKSDGCVYLRWKKSLK